MTEWPEPVDCPADAYDALEAAFGRWPYFVRAEDHENGLYLDAPLGSIVVIHARYCTPAGDLLFQGTPLRRMPPGRPTLPSEPRS